MAGHSEINLITLQNCDAVKVRQLCSIFFLNLKIRYHFQTDGVYEFIEK